MKISQIGAADQTLSGPPDTTTLFAGNIADGDLMWAVQTSAAQLTAFLQAPQTWVTALAELSDWTDASGGTAGTPSLTGVFAVRMDSPPSTLPPDSGDVIIEGISGTGYVTVKPSPSASQYLISATRLMRLANRALRGEKQIAKAELATDSDGLLDGYWASFSLNSDGTPKTLDIFSDASGGLFYGHVQVWSASDGTDKATAIASFLVTAFQDHTGYMGALDACQQVVNQGLGVSSGLPGTSISFSAATPSPITFSYLSDGPNDQPACDVIDGTLSGSGPTMTGSAVKDYSG